MDKTVTTSQAGTSVSSSREGAIETEGLAAWEDRTLSSIFRISLDPNHLQTSQNHRLQYLQSVRSDLEDEGAPLRLSTSILDTAIQVAASKAPKGSPLDYLLSCWKRVSAAYKPYRSQKRPDAKGEIVKEARRLCMSYCIFAITMPELFGSAPSDVNPLTSHLLVEPDDDRGVCYDFLSYAVERAKDDDTVIPAIVDAIEQLSQRLSNITMNGDFKPYVLGLRNLLRFDPIVEAIAKSESFLPVPTDAYSFERRTLLGPFFALSPLHGEAASMYFPSPKTLDRGAVVNSQRALRMALDAHQQDLGDIVDRFIKTSKSARETMLEWFAYCLNINHKRRAMQVDPKTVSTDGFMINLTTSLDRLCEPFMDATFSKVDRIDVDYLRRSPRVSIKDETKLNADQSLSDDFYSKPAPGQNNFISEVFFLTLAAHHYGTEAVNTSLNRLEKQLKQMERRLRELEEEGQKFATDPPRRRAYEMALQKYKDQLDKGISHKYAVQGVLLDEQTQGRSMLFMRYVIVWMLRLVAPGQPYPKQPIQLPLSTEQPEVFRCLPEYFLEDVVSNFKFIMRNMPQIVNSTQADELIMLCITFLRSSEYVKNPYLKADLITIMFQGVWPVYGRPRGVLGDLLNALPYCLEHLFHALIKFYIEAEFTGGHSQFFDKFNMRYEVFQIIKCIWPTQTYQQKLEQEAKINLDFFVRFVNLLLNDVTFVLDESLSAFRQIHDITEELERDAAVGNPMGPERKAEKEEALAQAKSLAKSYMSLTNETVAMLKLFTKALADSFTKSEIVQRLADMLDYNLDAMVGPKRTTLKVQNPEDYNFRPLQLLEDLVDVYINLRDKENFIFAVARDGRSYKPFNFEEATRILRGRGRTKSADDLKLWVAFGERVKKAKELDEQAEADMGEIPDEFLGMSGLRRGFPVVLTHPPDPLLYTLMEDPVILPTSKTTIDRSTIQSHLLSDPNDPFNRAPLKIEEVIPNTELKGKIQAFKSEKLGQRIAESGLMDTSAG